MRIRVLVLGAALLAGVTACGDSSAVGPSTSAGTAAPTSTPSAAAVAGNAVTIHNFAFTPASITTPVGTTITWTNSDGAAHTVTSLSGPASFDSRPDTSTPPKGISPGKTFSATLTKPGTYSYHCEIHQFMTGTVTVTG